MARPSRLNTVQSQPIFRRKESANDVEISPPNGCCGVPGNPSTENRCPSLGCHRPKSHSNALPESEDEESLLHCDTSSVDFSTATYAEYFLQNYTSPATANELPTNKDAVKPPPTNESTTLLRGAINQMKILVNDILHAHQIVKEYDESTCMSGLEEQFLKEKPTALESSAEKIRSSDSHLPNEHAVPSRFNFENFMRERRDAMEKRKQHLLPLIALVSKRIWRLLKEADDSETRKVATLAYLQGSAITDALQSYRPQGPSSTGIEGGATNLNKSVSVDLKKNVQEVITPPTAKEHQQCNELYIPQPGRVMISNATTELSPTDKAHPNLDVQTRVEHKVYTLSAGSASPQFEVLDKPLYAEIPRQKNVWNQSEAPFVSMQNPTEEAYPVKNAGLNTNGKLTESVHHELQQMQSVIAVTCAETWGYSHSTVSNLTGTASNSDLSIRNPWICTELDGAEHLATNDRVEGSRKQPMDFINLAGSCQHDPPSAFALPTEEPVLPKEFGGPIYQLLGSAATERGILSPCKTATMGRVNNPNSCVDLSEVRSLLTVSSHPIIVDELAEDTNGVVPDLLFPMQPPLRQAPYYGQTSFEDMKLFCNDLSQSDIEDPIPNHQEHQLRETLTHESTWDNEVMGCMADDPLEQEILHLLKYLDDAHAVSCHCRDPNFVNHQSYSLWQNVAAQKQPDKVADESFSLARQLENILQGTSQREAATLEALSTEPIVRSGAEVYVETNTFIQQTMTSSIAYEMTNPLRMHHEQLMQSSATEAIRQNDEVLWSHESTNTLKTNHNHGCPGNVTHHTRSHKGVQGHPSECLNKHPWNQGEIHTRQGAQLLPSDSSRNNHHNNRAPSFPWNRESSDPIDGFSLDQFLIARSLNTLSSQISPEINNEGTSKGPSDGLTQSVCQESSTAHDPTCWRAPY